MIVSLCVLFEILAIVFCLHYLYGEKPRVDIVTVGFIISEMILMNVINYCQLDQKWSLMIYPMVMTYCAVRFGFSFRVILVNTILYTIVLSTLQATIIIFSHILIGRFRVAEEVVANIILLCVVLFVLPKCNLNKLSKILQKKNKIVILTVLVIISSILLFLFNYKQSAGFDLFYYIVFIMCILLICFVVIDIGNHKMKAKEMESELRLHKLYEDSFHNLIEDICAKQHEFDNHINTIYSQHFLYDSYEELVKAQREYCSVITDANKFNKLLKKGNSVILGFLYGKLSEIDKKGIQIEYNVNVESLECSVPIYKMVEILGNLINNAVDEVLSHKEFNELFIGIREGENKIIMEVGNPVKKVDYAHIQEIFKKGYSSKGSNRGYGLYNVKKICEEYKINMSCDYRDEKLPVYFK